YRALPLPLQGTAKSLLSQRAVSELSWGSKLVRLGSPIPPKSFGLDRVYLPGDQASGGVLRIREPMKLVPRLCPGARRSSSPLRSQQALRRYAQLALRGAPR